MALLVTPGDRASFLRCRRQWDFGARCRRSLEPAAPPARPDLERALREALAIYYFPGMWDWQRTVTLPLVNQGFERAMDRQHAAAADAAAQGPGEQAWQDQREAGLSILRRYSGWAPEVDSFSPVLVETEYEANVPSPADPESGLVTPSGEAVRYRGRVDMLAVDAHDAYWLVRHRLVTGPWPPVAELLADLETITACWAWEQFYLGMAIEGVIFNEIRPPRAEAQAGAGAQAGAEPEPATPGPPATTDALGPPERPDRPGGLLQRWSAALRRRAPTAGNQAAGTQAAGNRAAADRATQHPVTDARVRQHEPSGGGRSIPQHRRMYATARRPARAETIEQRTAPDFRRTWLRRGRDEIDAEGQRLARDAAEMIAGPHVYPNPSLLNCPPCPYLDPCLAVFAGEDADPILAAGYRDRPPDQPLEGRLGSRAWGIGRGAAPPGFGGR
jgi:hypothetical protein